MAVIERIRSWLTAPRSAPSAGALTWAFLALGAFFRVADYLANRPLWIDEVSLRDGLATRPIFDFTHPLPHGQLAPPGFLVLGRISARLLGESSYAIRLLPLVAGVVALFLFVVVARRYLAPHAVPIAMGLFALSDDLIYYSTETKQYSTDLAVALGCFWMGSDLASGELTARRLARATAIGVAATWLSNASVFVLAGVGTALIASSIAGGRWRRAFTLSGISLAWAVSFAACYTVSQVLLSDDTVMWVWWYFAFLPVPPRSIADLERVSWAVVNAFMNPGGIVTPLGPLGSCLLASGLFLIGVASLARERRWRAIALVSPILFALAASGLHKYPFHGRVLLFLVPSLLMPVAEGLAAIGRLAGKVALVLLAGFLLASPIEEAVNHLEVARWRGFDSHGDMRNDLLDYLESRQANRKNMEALRERMKTRARPTPIRGATSP